MKQILVALTFLLSRSVFATEINNSAMTEILLLKSQISRSEITSISARREWKKGIELKKQGLEKELNQKCGALKGTLATRDFNSDFNVSLAARTIEGACGLSLPEGYRWELTY